MRLIGLDIGTTGCKASIFDSEGDLLSSASREYTVDIPCPNWAERMKRYQTRYEIYRDIYPAVNPIHRRL